MKWCICYYYFSILFPLIDSNWWINIKYGNVGCQYIQKIMRTNIFYHIDMLCPIWTSGNAYFTYSITLKKSRFTGILFFSWFKQKSLLVSSENNLLLVVINLEKEKTECFRNKPPIRSLHQRQGIARYWSFWCPDKKYSSLYPDIRTLAAYSHSFRTAHHMLPIRKTKSRSLF